MLPPDQAIAIDGIRQFLKLHATCGGASMDTPGLPGDTGYRAVAACRCGDTAEYWLTDALLPRQHLVRALASRPAA
jgi:hypothetical protein